MIGIIGYGFVGQALGSVLQDDYQIVDPKHEGVSFDHLLASNPEMIFICVPTPSTDEGCDDSLVLHYVDLLKDYDGIVVVKSTTPPKTVDKIMKVRPTTVIWPELLREQYAKNDMQHPKVIVIGANGSQIFNKLFRFIIDRTSIVIGPESIRHVSPIEASVFKYTVNSFLAMKVTFMHQMYLWMRERGDGESWSTVADVLSMEGRVGSSHLRAPGVHGFGFDGTCFPKDTIALSKQAEADGYPLSLLNAAIEINKELRQVK